MYSWLLIALKLFLFVQPCFSYLNRSVMELDIPGACNITNIYPFGMTTSLFERPPRTGFEIQCASGNLTVQLGNRLFEVTDISLDGQIRILVPASTSRCSKVSEPAYPIADLHGTPYTYNTTNMFTFIGCDAHALIQTTQGNPLVGCASFCFLNDLRFINHSPCTGMGCCQAPVPPRLKNFSLNFTSISLQSCRVAQNNGQPVCDKFFILDPNKFNLSSDEILSDGKEQKEVVLDWSIGNETCNIARLNNDSFACVAKHSICSDYTDLVGYRCFCSQGFQGNPYIEDGCEGIHIRP